MSLESMILPYTLFLQEEKMQVELEVICNNLF